MDSAKVFLIVLFTFANFRVNPAVAQLNKSHITANEFNPFELDNITIQHAVDSSNLVSLNLPPTPNRGSPGNTDDAASRGDCPANLIPLVPSISGRGGYTTEDYPTVWIYVPYPLTPDSPAIFSLENSQGEEIYESLPITDLEEPGIVRIPLPSTGIALTVGEDYDWYFRVYCNDPERTDLPDQAAGWIRRVPADTPADQIWYDILTDLGERHRANPTDQAITRDWATLLRSVGLDPIVSEPFAP